jgi:hypothetical protein
VSLLIDANPDPVLRFDADPDLSQNDDDPSGSGSATLGLTTASSKLFSGIIEQKIRKTETLILQMTV